MAKTETTTATKVAVHSGEFHGDDAFAAATLERALPAVVEILRTRDEAVLAACDLVVDVGGAYDGVHLFDHHQKGRAGERPNGVPYAAFGLVWRRFGAEVCGGDADVAAEVDRALVQGVDATDNGVTLWTEAVPGVGPYTVSHAVSDMNPCGDEPHDYDAAFGRAVEFASRILDRAIAQAQATVAAKRTVAAAIAASEENVVVFDRYSFEWAGLVAEASTDALFVLYPSEDGSYWYVQCVPPTRGSFDMRRPLPAPLGGLRGAALAEKSGIEGAVFVHPGRFIGGAATCEGARRLATFTGK